MTRAVRFDAYGPADVLHVADVPTPEPGPGQVLVEVVATSINPGEIMIREGAMHEQNPATFPSGQGSDLAGRVLAVGAGVSGWSPGDQVLGWTDERAAQAEHVVVPEGQLAALPDSVPWEQAGSLYVAGGTAHGMVEVLGDVSDRTVLVAGAAGGVGVIATQLLRERGARVLAVAGGGNAEFLTGLGAEHLVYGDDLADRVRAAAPDGLDAVLDCYGGGYVELGLSLDVVPERVVTIIDFETAQQRGATVVWGYDVTSAQVLAALAERIADGRLSIPIAATFPLEQVREAYALLAERHTRGKIVLTP